MIAKQIKNEKIANMQLQHCITKSIVQSQDIYDSRKQLNYHNVQIFCMRFTNEMRNNVNLTRFSL